MARLTFDLTALRVLLVEDETLAREIEQNALYELGIERVTVAENGAVALEAMGRGLPYDLVISDWNMPKLDGMGFLKSLREVNNNLPFLMVTNNETIDKVRQALNAGADGYIIKPFSLNKLREAIHLALAAHIDIPVAAGNAVNDISEELTEVVEWLQSVLARPVSGGVAAKGNGVDAETLQNIQALAARVSGQLDGFLNRASYGRPEHLVVVRLHNDCLTALLSGRADLLELETSNSILDGLTHAAELVTG